MYNKLQLASLFCCSCCSDDNDDDIEVQKVLQQPSSTTNNNKLHVTISTWLKSELPELKQHCARIFSGKIRRNRKSVEFGYDPMSYALNFEDDCYSRIDDEYPIRDFSSRLPSSPPPLTEKKNGVVSKDISAWSS